MQFAPGTIPDTARVATDTVLKFELPPPSCVPENAAMNTEGFGCLTITSIYSAPMWDPPFGGWFTSSWDPVTPFAPAALPAAHFTLVLPVPDGVVPEHATVWPYSAARPAATAPESA